MFFTLLLSCLNKTKFVANDIEHRNVSTLQFSIFTSDLMLRHCSLYTRKMNLYIVQESGSILVVDCFQDLC